MDNQRSFIQHIAGLRGVAVLLVVLGHLSIPGFSAGFIGVDIFFVISGFLITGILVKEYQANRDPESRIGSISLKAFYLRRARRILPASVLVTIVVVVFSWLFNNQARFQTVLADSIWATFFGANVNFALKSTDYFQIGAAPSPFQHFWSLSVEEQFYFIWPALIVSVLALRALRFRGSLISWEKRLTVLFGGVTVISFLFMLTGFFLNPSLSYFLTASRAWELALGALGAMLVRHEDGVLQRFHSSKLGKFLPTLLLVVSFFFITDRNFGYTLPLIVVASFLIVTKNSDYSHLDVKALSNKVIGFVGSISYSLYLWHWPLIVFAGELGFGGELLHKFVILVISIGLSTVSYYFVELRFQRIELPKFYVDNSLPLSKPFWFTTAAGLSIFVLVLPSVAVQPQIQTAIASVIQPRVEDQPIPSVTPTPTNTGSPNEQDWLTRRQAEIRASNDSIAAKGFLTEKQISEVNRVASGDTYAKGFDFSCTWGECSLGDPSAKTRILLLGDSYALMYQSTLSGIYRSGASIYVKSMISGQCGNFLGERSLLESLSPSIKEACIKQHARILSYVSSLESKYDYVILSASQSYNPEYYVEDSTSYTTQVKNAGLKTIILGQAPVGKDLSMCLNKEYSNYNECSGARATSITDYTVAKRAKVAFGDVGPLFCIGNFCPLIIGDSPVTARGHLTDAAGFQIAPYFLEFLDSAQAPKG